MNNVAIIDYGMCNLDSVARAVEECGGTPVVTDKREDIARASRVILPGVGSFTEAMRRIRERALDQVLREEVLEKQVPLLGICLGMHMLASTGFEGGVTEGLGWIAGEVRKLEPAGEDLRIPHVGWNSLEPVHDTSLLAGVDPNRDFYFVHSYHFAPADPDVVRARTPFARGFVSVVQRDHIFGVQFHPEKSQRAGFHVLRNFLAV